MKVVVLAGGLSPERDVSLSSAALIANALLENDHQVFVLDLFFGYQGSLKDFPFVSKKSKERFSFKVPETEPDLGKLAREHPEIDGYIGPQVLQVCALADKVFIALHGSVGENGQIQAYFDLHGISYTGTGYTGSLLAMDKDISKKLVETIGVKTAKWSVLDLSRARTDHVESPVGYPCVVKPLSCGSSIGISLVVNEHGFGEAIQAAKAYEDRILVERWIEGREFSCGILGGKALPAIEIIPKQGFYDYKNKYQAGLTEELCPAHLGAAASRVIGETTERIHQLLRLGFYSRSDFIMDSNNDFYYLESNTLPGMTPTSLLPQEAAAAGIDYVELCDSILYAEARRGF
jgi:D-alanine-D-alanine ligase